MGSGGFAPYGEFDGLMSDQYAACTYLEHGHLVGVTKDGQIQIFQQMDTLQVISQENTTFIEPGTSMGTRLNFYLVTPCRFGFIVASPDVLYFFKYTPLSKKDKEENVEKDQY